MSQESLAALAQAAGVSRQWIDASGQPKTVSDDSLQAVLAALELPCASQQQCADSLAHLASLRGGSHLPTLQTAVQGQAVVLALDPGFAGRRYRIVLEQGGEIDGVLATHGPQTVQLPAVAHCGYHRLVVDETLTTLAVAPARCYGVADALAAAARRGTGVVGAAAASEAFATQATAAAAASAIAGAGPAGARRAWGLGVQLYSLRRPGDGGIGDFGALESFTRNAAAQGAASVAISPVHAMFSADTSRYSPYGPSSRLFLNALYIDPAAVSGKEAYAAARNTLGQAACSKLALLEQDELIDWPQAARLRLDLLRQLHRQAIATGGRAEAAELAQFRQRGGQALQDHARFEMLHALQLAHGESGDWRHWPEDMRDPRGAAVATLAMRHQEEVDFHLFLQWQAARGLSAAQACARAAGMPIGLIADLAIGADRGGSQAWSRQRDMINGLSVGAPPDTLSTRGQNWGLGAFSPQAMLERGFEGYIEMLRAVFAHCGGVRIDHVLGLARLWLVPEGASAADGAYLQFPLVDLLRLIALESHRHQAIVIGEDLGTVPPGFDTQIADAGLLGIRVLFFEREGGGAPGFKPPSRWSGHAIATTTTHDLPTVAGWWHGIDIDWRARLDLLPLGESAKQAHAARTLERRELWDAFTLAGVTSAPMPASTDGASVIDAALAYIAATPAPLAIVPIEDALCLEQQPNLPGTVDTHPNWRRRLPLQVEHLFDSAAVRRRLALLNQAPSSPGVP